GTTRGGRTPECRACRRSRVSWAASPCGPRQFSAGWHGYAARAMEHRFTGPDFTIGVEEELMIVDAETLDLVNEIESLLAEVPQGTIKPELMESVLEIAT